MTVGTQAALWHLDGHRPQALARLFELLRIPSISTDPARNADCETAARWLAAELSSVGFDAAVRPTAGRPIVVGHRKKPDAPQHILFYGHYDVQPVDPLDLWTTPPFEPRIADDARNGAIIVGRGASDDKGQLMTFVEACRAFLATAGELPVSVTVMLEGEEESGSRNLEPFLRANAAELSVDLALVCDSGQWTASRPAVTTMLRGLAHCELVVKGPNRDLHSGVYGAAAINPIRALTGILGAMHDAKGRVTIPGFYDDIVEPPASQLEGWRQLGFDEGAFLGGIGLATPAGETGRSVLEQIWARPTAEVNGIHGGYTGPGTKTVIPAQAAAKLSFRLVPGMDPDGVLDRFDAFVRANLHVECRYELHHRHGSPAVGFDTSSPAMTAAAGALQAEWGEAPALIGSGGSIPVVGLMKTVLDMDSLLVGFALDDDRIHSPNEKYNVRSFEQGARSWVRILGALSALGRLAKARPSGGMR